MGGIARPVIPAVIDAVGHRVEETDPLGDHVTVMERQADVGSSDLKVGIAIEFNRELPLGQEGLLRSSTTPEA